MKPLEENQRGETIAILSAREVAKAIESYIRTERTDILKHLPDGKMQVWLHNDRAGIAV